MQWLHCLLGANMRKHLLIKLGFTLLYLGAPKLYAMSLDARCSSQGQWTTNALAGISQLRGVVSKLKSSGDVFDSSGNIIKNKCANLSIALNKTIEDTEKALTSLDKDSKTSGSSSLLSIPDELRALKNYYSSSNQTGSNKSSILNMMASKAISFAVKNTSNVNTSDDLQKEDLQNFGQHMRAGSNAALGSMVAFLDELPQSQECIYGNTAEAAMIGSLVNVMGAFASAGQNSTGNKLATAINKLTSYLYANRLSDVNRQLNNAEFQNSLACLLESTSEAYCSARDASYALRRGQVLTLDQQSNGIKMSKLENPLNGYFILTHALPVITDWLLKVQVGVQPRTAQDAQFKKIVTNNVNSFFNSVFDLQGKLSEKIQTILGYQDKEAQAISVVHLILELTHEMGAGGRGFASPGEGPEVNFFTQGRMGLKIAFDISDFKEVLPESVFSTDSKVPRVLTPEQWFQSPDGLKYVKAQIGTDVGHYLEVISGNVDDIVKTSTRNAISYYGTWFIVDKGQLVSESVTRINFTVRDSLMLVYSYLKGFSEKSNKENVPSMLLAYVDETLFRIQKILTAYDKASRFYNSEVKPFLRDLKLENIKRFKLNNSTPSYFELIGGVSGSCKDSKGKLVDDCKLEDLLSDKNLVDMFKRLNDSNSNIIEIIYDELNVMLSRSSFLANRMAIFVQADILSQIKNNKNLTEFERDFYTATGLADYTELMSQYQSSPEAARFDLSQAMVLHKTSIESLEKLFKNSLPGQIAHLRALSNNMSTAPNDMSLDSLNRLLYDSDKIRDRPTATATERALMAKERNTFDPISKIWNWSKKIAIAGFDKLMQPDRYELNLELPIYERTTSPTDEFNSAKDLYEKLCIQAMAFNDLSIYERDCSDVVLKSIQSKSQLNVLNPQIRRFIERSAVSWKAKLREGQENLEIRDPKKWQSYNHSVRICAYRDFLRNSLVTNLTSAQNISHFDPQFNDQTNEMLDTLITFDKNAAEEAKKRLFEIQSLEQTRKEQLESISSNREKNLPLPKLKIENFKTSNELPTGAQ